MQTNTIKSECSLCKGTGITETTEYSTKARVSVKCNVCRGRGYFEVEKA